MLVSAVHPWHCAGWEGSDKIIYFLFIVVYFIIYFVFMKKSRKLTLLFLRASSTSLFVPDKRDRTNSTILWVAVSWFCLLCARSLSQLGFTPSSAGTR